MKIGIYGGSFDPPHYGHRNIAEFIIKELNLDKLLIIPVGKGSYGKETATPAECRLEMSKLAFEKIDKVEVSPIEIDSKELCYTIDTLNNIIKKYGKDNEYFEIIGEDSANYFDKWKEYKKILELSTVIVLKRKGYTNVVESSKIKILDNPYFNISSTEIKNKIKNCEDISEYVGKEIDEYIKNKKLYK